MSIKNCLRKHGDKSLLFAAFTLTILMIVKNRSTQISDDKKHKDDSSVCQRNCKIPSLESGDQFRNYFLKPRYTCKDLRWFGKGEGKKAVCLDEELDIDPGNCNVLSFGINNEWSFDDHFDRFGCKVYSFDPTMGQEAHQRSSNIRFFNLGIGNVNSKRLLGMNGKFDYFQVERYENILERLGLTHSPIDYLKMDVELSELEFFQDVFRNSPHLLRNIKQIGMELHHGYLGEGVTGNPMEISETSPTSTFTIFWQYLHELECSGFKLTNSTNSMRWTEAVWVRIPTL